MALSGQISCSEECNMVTIFFGKLGYVNCIMFIYNVVYSKSLIVY